MDTASRKLNRIAIALRQVLPVADVPTGEGFGKVFSELVAEAGGRKGPEIRPLRQETALNILDLMIPMLRLRFAATLRFRCLLRSRHGPGMVEPARPSDAVNSRAERIARIAMDSLHTLSRQGISQRNLRQALVSSFGAELINRIGASITSKDPSLECRRAEH